MVKKNKDDAKFLKICINLSKVNIATTSPNPSVGCLLVKNNIIISQGVTSKNGRPHAEFNAINKISDKSKLKGSTLYVSLEPCCHHGKTPPCTDAIINSGITRVVIAAIDNDDRVNGKSINLLRKHGIEVDVMEMPEAYEVNKRFFAANKNGTPYVTLKLATSMDGKVALANNESKWITSADSRKVGHYYRYLNDAILIGKNTLINDNPSLNCRIKGLEDNSPTIIIASNNIDFTRNYKIFKNKKVHKVILCLDNEDNKSKALEFQDSNTSVIYSPAQKNILNMRFCLQEIRRHSINSILIEGGSVTSTALLKQNLVNEIIWFTNNKIFGADSKDAIEAMNIQAVNDSLSQFELKESRIINKQDLLAIYQNPTS